MEEQARSVYSKIITVLSGVSVLLSRLFLVAVVVPSTAGMLMLAAASGWSFTGAALMVAEVQADAQQIGKATAPGHYLVKRCIEPHQVNAERLPVPADAVCKDWVVEEVAVSDYAAGAGKVLFGVYLSLVFVSGGLVIAFWPQSRLRVRQRICTDLVAIFNKLKTSVSGKPAA